MQQAAKIKITSLVLIAGLLLIGGCESSKNDASPFPFESHPADWLPTGHMVAAETNLASCTQCHGSDLSGGIARVSCTSCHIGDATSIHPVSWGTTTQLFTLNHPPYVAAHGSTSCQNAYCHGTDLSGVANSGPGCVTCHVNGQFPFLPDNCLSCHGNPPSGTVYPNIAGAHNTATGHFAPSVTLPDGCNTCHLGAGAGTLNHDTGTVVVQLMSSVYSAESGTAVYNSDGTCSNVSCHGGQTTPTWETGSIDVNNSCTSCHIYGTTEYNSFYSGKHYLHLYGQTDQVITCTDCHDEVYLATVHFQALNTNVFYVPASWTILGNVNYVSGDCSPSLCHDGGVDFGSWN